MSKTLRPPQFGPGTGSGRRPIPADLYLLRWSPVVEMLKAGRSVREIKVKHGACPETVRHVRRFMIGDGWTPPVHVAKRIERQKVEPRPPRLGMTQEERLQKCSGVVFWLREGKTVKQAAELEGLSVNTVRVVRRALVARGELGGAAQRAFRRAVSSSAMIFLSWAGLGFGRSWLT